MTKISQLRGVTIVALGLVTLFLSGCSRKDGKESTAKKATAPTVNGLFPDASTRIVVIPTMSSMVSDSNTVHCTNIEYLWNEILRRSDQQITGNALVDILSQSKTWMNSMDTTKLILAAGVPGEVRESVIRQYLKKYKIDKSDLQAQGETFWGYTDKFVNYKYEEPFPERNLKFQGTDVTAFGFGSGFGTGYLKDYFKHQFDILYFDNQGQFIVRLNPANAKDEIILAMIPKGKTFLEMFNFSQQKITAGRDDTKKNPYAHNLNEDDELIIPSILFSAIHHYDELAGIKFSSRYGTIASPEQNIRFKFDRRGVVMDAEASAPDSVGIPQPPKIMHYDRAFYLYIKEANAPYPYFNLWIANVGILEKK